jgi:glucose/arabinose dehydrogenase
VQNGVLSPTPVITLTDLNNYGDRGLIGIAVDPSFASNGYLYLSYTYENSPGANIAGSKTGRIVRVTVI